MVAANLQQVQTGVHRQVGQGEVVGGGDEVGQGAPTVSIHIHVITQTGPCRPALSYRIVSYHLSAAAAVCSRSSMTSSTG